MTAARILTARPFRGRLRFHQRRAGRFRPRAAPPPPASGGRPPRRVSKSGGRSWMTAARILTAGAFRPLSGQSPFRGPFRGRLRFHQRGAGAVPPSLVQKCSASPSGVRRSPSASGIEVRRALLDDCGRILTAWPFRGRLRFHQRGAGRFRPPWFRSAAPPPPASGGRPPRRVSKSGGRSWMTAAGVLLVLMPFRFYDAP